PQVITRLEQENINVAGGTVKEGRTDYMVRTLNEFAGVDEIADTIIATVDGRDIRLRYLGTVERSHREREMAVHTDGLESVQIDVFKEADANIVALSKRVRAALGTLGPELRESEDVELGIVADRSLFIESAIDEVENTAIVGGALAI